MWSDERWKVARKLGNKPFGFTFFWTNPTLQVQKVSWGYANLSGKPNPANYAIFGTWGYVFLGQTQPCLFLRRLIMWRPSNFRRQGALRMWQCQYSTLLKFYHILWMMWAWHALRMSKHGIGFFTGSIWRDILPATSMFQYHFMVMMFRSTDKVIASQACTSTSRCLGRRGSGAHTTAFGQCGRIWLQGASLYGQFWLSSSLLWTRHFTVSGKAEQNLLWQS